MVDGEGTNVDADCSVGFHNLFAGTSVESFVADADEIFLEVPLARTNGERAWEDRKEMVKWKLNVYVL